MKVQKLSEFDIQELRKIGKRKHLVGYLLTCYETIFAHACDPNAETLEFKPEILDALNKSAEIEQVREENEKLKGILSGDPNLTATKEQREAWRLSAVRYADKVEAENSTLRDAAYHFMHCVECSQEAEKCFEGKQFELILQGEKKDVQN